MTKTKTTLSTGVESIRPSFELHVWFFALPGLVSRMKLNMGGPLLQDLLLVAVVVEMVIVVVVAVAVTVAT